MKRYLFIFTLLAVLAMCAVPAAAADGVGAEDYLYSASGGNITLTKYFGEDESEIIIPAEIDGMPVTKIGEKCFEDHEEIERVILPDTLKVIDYRAFYGCSNLTDMNMPETLEKTGGWVFAHTGFESFTFPEGFTSLGYGAFYGSDNLKTVILPEGVTSIGENTFRMCPKLESVTIPSAEIEINIKGFQEKSKVTIIGVPGSYAEKYAKAIEIGFEAYEKPEETAETESAADGWICPGCGKEAEGNFCPYCGTKKPAEGIICTECGESYPADAGYAFCPNCGAVLPKPESTPESVVTSEPESTPEPAPTPEQIPEQTPEPTSLPEPIEAAAAETTDAEEDSPVQDESESSLTEYVLSELGNSVYRETYDALSGGETVAMGAWGTTAKGVQQTLIDFGQKLSADGQAGGKTFDALHAVQDAFGMARTDKVDGAAYEALLLRLLVLREMEEDEYSVTDKICSLPGEPVDYDECSYMMACADYLKGNYYKARERFEDCYWGDAEERAEKCVQPWPSTGQIWKDNSLGAGTQLTVKVNGEPDVGMHVKIYQENGNLAAMLFIGGSGSASTWLPGGTYVIKDGTGRDWYGQEDSFGYYGDYEVMTFDDYGTTEVDLQAGYSYTITINVQNASPDASNVGSMYDDYEDF